MSNIEITIRAIVALIVGVSLGIAMMQFVIRQKKFFEGEIKNGNKNC